MSRLESQVDQMFPLQRDKEKNQVNFNLDPRREVESIQTIEEHSQNQNVQPAKLRAYPSERATQAVHDFEISDPELRESQEKIAFTENCTESLDSDFLKVEKFLEQGLFKEAAAIAEFILKDKFQNLMALEVLAICKEKLNHIEEAIDVRLQISGIVQDFGNMALLGHLLYRNGDEERAEKVYNQALGFNQNEEGEIFEIEKNLGNILLRKGDIEGAEEHYHRAFSINQESDTLLVNLGTLEIQRSQFSQALAKFRMAVAKNPNNDKGWVGLGLIHREYGDHELAFGNVERALDVNPSNETAIQLMIDWGSHDNQLDRCLSRVESFIALNPNNYQIELAYVKILFCTDRLLSAYKHIIKIKAIYPEEPEVKNIFSLISEKMNSLEQSI